MSLPCIDIRIPFWSNDRPSKMMELHVHHPGGTLGMNRVPEHPITIQVLNRDLKTVEQAIQVEVMDAFRLIDALRSIDQAWHNEKMRG